MQGSCRDSEAHGRSRVALLAARPHGKAATMKIYELAQNLNEAKLMRDAGFGYSTKAAAEQSKKAALRDGGDPFYINQLKTYHLEALATPSGEEGRK